MISNMRIKRIRTTSLIDELARAQRTFARDLQTDSGSRTIALVRMSRGKMLIKILLVYEFATAARLSLSKARITHPVLDCPEILFEMGC